MAGPVVKPALKAAPMTPRRAALTARKMAGITMAAPWKNGALMLMPPKVSPAVNGPTNLAKAPAALLRPRIWP